MLAINQQSNLFIAGICLDQQFESGWSFENICFLDCKERAEEIGNFNRLLDFHHNKAAEQSRVKRLNQSLTIGTDELSRFLSHLIRYCKLFDSVTHKNWCRLCPSKLNSEQRPHVTILYSHSSCFIGKTRAYQPRHSIHQMY